MKKKIKNWFIYRFSIVRKINFHFFKKRCALLARKECEERRYVNFENVNLLSRDLECPYWYSIEENNFYGNGKSIFKSFSHLHEDKVGIEHGLIFGSLVQSFHIESWTEAVVTYSDYRRNYLSRKSDKKIICVGPYIHYADTRNVISNEDKRRLKEAWGKTLLVFPFHTLKTLDHKYDEEEFLNYIQTHSKQFDTVLVCFYWADIQKKRHSSFLKQGYRVVTAGHNNDYYFLDRLKTYIELSDATLSNSVGTHVGYCIYLNKPVVLFQQEHQLKSNTRKNYEFNQRDDSDNDSLYSSKEMIYRLFKEENFNSISREQYDCISYIFGFKYVK